MEQIIEIAKRLDIAQLVAIVLIFWVFYQRLDKKFEKIDKQFDKVDEKFAEIRQEISEIKQDVKELRTSLNRMEGAFYSKECCMLKDERNLKKAE